MTTQLDPLTNLPLHKMLDRDLHARWVAALRSGEYTQGRTAFETVTYATPAHTEPTVKNCCLGVLCHVAGEPVKRVSSSGFILNDNYDFVASCFGEGEGENDLPTVTALWNRNDIHGQTFAELADFIEETL